MTARFAHMSPLRDGRILRMLVLAVMLTEALGWDAWRGRAEVIVPYFIASGTGQVIAQFLIAA